MKSNTTVLVRISKVFDSAPVFDEPAVSITVPENIAVDDCFLQVRTMDVHSHLWLLYHAYVTALSLLENDIQEELLYTSEFTQRMDT